MKRMFFAFLLAVAVPVFALPAFAQPDEPVIYIIKKGDTLWGLSDRFLKDPFYWPDLWARNPKITNPHLIYPGQKVRIYPDRIEIEPAPTAARASLPAEESALEQKFIVTGGEGFLLEKKLSPSGHVIVTNYDRNMVGDNDFVYTDIGMNDGARTGDLFSVFNMMEEVRHPATNSFVGYRVDSLGTVRLVELEEKNSKAFVTRSYQEIVPGSYLMAYRGNRREVSLKAAANNLAGCIVSARNGNISLGNGDIAYLDLGMKQGLEAGNLLYIVRDFKPPKLYTDREVGDLPKDVIGAIVVVETDENTSTGLIVKCTEAIYRGDRVESAQK
ncbi:MAG: peptidoglycan-binding protein LysM [Geobacteraceae bacterium]|nr:peptidoglycan-binding protein LysM [Geobacteraceae bacterium]